jgi:hypothetical protein
VTAGLRRWWRGVSWAARRLALPLLLVLFGLGVLLSEYAHHVTVFLPIPDDSAIALFAERILRGDPVAILVLVAIVWLIGNGVDPDAICWVRPRDPWMFNRAVVQPDPVVYAGMAADIHEASRDALSPDDLFIRMEYAGSLYRSRIPPDRARDADVAAAVARVRAAAEAGLARLAQLGGMAG